MKEMVHNAIIIDTNAFDAKGNDFCGLFSEILPSLFSTINRLNLQLLTHPVLKGETLEHIRTSDLANRPSDAIKALTRNKQILSLIGVQVEDVAGMLEKLDLVSRTEEKFCSYFDLAISLPYTNPEGIFRKYFEGRPPFSKTGKKKSEFPDAFVIDSLLNYLKENRDQSVIVISDDHDWQAALDTEPNATLVKNIDEAMIMLNNYEEQILSVLHSCFEPLALYIRENALSDVWFELQDYDHEDDLEISTVELIGIEEGIIPLGLSGEEIVVQVELLLQASGSTIIIDYDGSIWDREDKEYILTSFQAMDFTDAQGKVKCELHIISDGDNGNNIQSCRLVAPHGVCLILDEENIQLTDISFNPVEDAAAEMMDALEEYYKH